MKTCTYDNPATMRRECWQDGRLRCFYAAELFFLKEPTPGKHFFFGANIGPWTEGQLVGDREALPPDTIST